MIKAAQTQRIDRRMVRLWQGGILTPVGLNARLGAALKAKGAAWVIEGLHRLEALRALVEDTIVGFLVRARLR